MITVKKIIRTAGVLLLTVLLLNSCVSKKVEEFPFVSLDSIDLTPKTTEYRIIISATASAELTSAAEELRDRLHEKTSATVSVCPYSDELIYKMTVWDIYVGNTGCDYSAEALRDMRSDDYTCRSYDYYSIIGGRNDSATESAIDRYISELLPLATYCDFIPEGGGFDYFGSYAVENITLLEARLSQFEIICDKDVSAEVNTAYAFRSDLSTRAGYYLDISYGDTNGKSISFKLDKNCNAGEAYVSASDGGIYVRAASAYGLKVASERLLNIICPEGSTGSFSPSIPEELFVAYSEPILDLSFLCLSGILPIGAPSEITDIQSAVDENSPDAVFFGELTDSDKERISNVLSDYNDENSLSVFVQNNVSAELICRERAGGLLLEGYRVTGKGIDMALLYVSGSADINTDIELPQELISSGLPVLTVIHTFNSREVRAVYDENPNFSRVCSDSVTLYGDSFSFVCYADTGHLSVSLSALEDSCGYRQISVRAIG